VSLTPFLYALFGLAALFALIGVSHGARARRHWRERRRVAASLRVAWSLVFLLLALLGALGGGALLGWHRLASEEPIAQIESRLISPQRYAVDIQTPDGTRRHVELDGDDWQLDARVIKWTPRAVMLGAPPLYRLDRVGGRYHDVAQERTGPRSVVSLADDPWPDLWSIKKEFPGWLPWMDADYGSAAYLPLVDGGRYEVSLAAAGGLVARPADEATSRKLRGDER
jgi:hypothetical protein